MPQIGPLEILIIAVVALIVFGPERLPEIARKIGSAAGEMRRMASEVQDEFQSGLDDPDEDDEVEGRHTGTGKTAPAPTADGPAQTPPVRTRPPKSDSAEAGTPEAAADTSDGEPAPDKT